VSDLISEDWIVALDAKFDEALQVNGDEVGNAEMGASPNDFTDFPDAQFRFGHQLSLHAAKPP
jgi:hypothetical protein